jgi:methyl-accepting chemotaxis protein
VAERINRIVHDTRPAILAMEKAMDAVKEGREVSEQARASLQQISILAQESTGISSSIATASRDQAQATKGVATSMQSMSEIGARSAASAKEASTSVRELVALAKRLEQEVSRFKI